MTTLLAIETSAGLCSLAVRAGGEWIEDTQNVDRLHNQVVLEMLESLTRRAGVRRNEFHVVAFAAGPGSFTGVRIAASLAQGVAFASGARVIPVSSSRALALAASAHAEFPRGGARVLTLTRSRRDAYYLAGYAVDENHQVGCLLPDRLHQGVDAPVDPRPEDWLGAGERPPWWPQPAPFLEGVAVTAGEVGRLAQAALARGEDVAPEAGLPVYVAGDSPWRPAQP